MCVVEYVLSARSWMYQLVSAVSCLRALCFHGQINLIPWRLTGSEAENGATRLENPSGGGVMERRSPIVQEPLSLRVFESCSLGVQGPHVQIMCKGFILKPDIHSNPKN